MTSLRSVSDTFTDEERLHTILKQWLADGVRP